jgi:transposase InsO family protein
MLTNDTLRDILVSEKGTIMQTKLHKNARTTLAVRQEIKKSSLSAYALAKLYHINWETAKKWKTTETLEDKSSRPHKLNTLLSLEDEELICFERKQFKKTIDEIYLTLEDKIANLYPMKVYRCLKRHGLNVLPDEFVEAERKIKKFRKYGIGYLHLDLLYSPKINKERSYIYTAIDRVTKIAFIYALIKRKNKETGARFLKAVLKFYPYKINYILTDNDFEFNYKALSKNKRTKEIHLLDKICKKSKIKHRTIKFKHPWTNGMSESINKRIKNSVLRKYRFQTIFELKEKLIEFVNDYNMNKRLKSLNYKTPAQYLKDNKDIILQRIVI